MKDINEIQIEIEQFHLDILNLYKEINKQYKSINFQVPTNLNDFTILQLAQKYHELMNMLA